MKLPMAFVLLSAAARATVVSAFSVRTATVSCSTRSLSGSCHRPSSAAAAATSLFSGTANPTSPTTTLFGLRTPSRLFSTAEATEESDTEGAVPITLLAGFLGSGKTTALKNLLENREGIKVGVIVNDVAAVNIDAKLIANPGNDGEAPSSADRVDAGTAIETDFGGTVELQNGCACCSLADELLTSVETLMDGRDFDAVVVELSGVADPVAVKQNWDMARMVSFGCLICLDSPLCFVCISYMQVAIAMCNSILSTISHHLSYDISLTQILEQPPRYQIGQREPRGDRC